MKRFRAWLGGWRELPDLLCMLTLMIGFAIMLRFCSAHSP